MYHKAMACMITESFSGGNGPSCPPASYAYVVLVVSVVAVPELAPCPWPLLTRLS